MWRGGDPPLTSLGYIVFQGSLHTDPARLPLPYGKPGGYIVFQRALHPDPALLPLRKIMGCIVFQGALAYIRTRLYYVAMLAQGKSSNHE